MATGEKICIGTTGQKCTKYTLVQQHKNARSKHRYNRTNKHKVGVAMRPERLCHDFGEESDKLSVFFPGELSLDFYLATGEKRGLLI